MSWTRNIPVSYYEKIALLLLAAKLEGEGYTARLSVPQADSEARDPKAGIDWARAVRAVQLLGRAFVRKDDNVTESYAAVVLSEEDRVDLRSGLHGLLRGWVEADRAYRYDGIWHDNGGNLDLVAWSPSETLMIEAKGVTLQDKDDPSINWTASAKAASEDIKGKDRDVSWRTQGEAKHGLFFPGVNDPATGKGFLSALETAWPKGRPRDARTPIFLIDSVGEIRRTTAEELAAADSL